VAVILARVIADDPDLKPLPATISPAVQRTVELCLQKDPRKRLRDIGDVKLALAGAFETGGGTGAAFAALAARPPAWRRMLVPMAMLVAGALLAGAAAWTLRPAPEARPVNRFTFTFSIPADQQLRAGEIFALAPDGRQFVYKTQRGLYLRRLDELEPRLIPGTAEGGAPLFSPNSQHILYATDRSTWEQIATSGGASVFIGPRQGLALGASWSEDGTIYFAQPAGIFRVPAAGGGAELLIAPENAENFHGPALLPDGDSLLFSIADGAAWDAARIVVQSLATGERTELLSGGSDARYVSTGHIVYAYGDTLFAVAFDLDTLTVSGGAVPLVRGVMRAGQAGAGGANYGIANNGTLAYVAATPAGGRRTLTWVDRDGREEPIAIEPSTYMYPRISPDGRRVVLDDRNSNDDVWIWDFRGQTRTRITIGGSGGQYPAWTNDGARLARADTGGAIVVVAANNTGTAQTLVPAGTLLAGRPSPYFFTPDDRALVFRDQNHPETADNILMVGADGGGTPTPLLAASYNERNAELSPDARFMAYQSDESGRWEVYVRPFPNVDDDRVPVSNAGGIEPLWSRDGRELFYLAGEAGSLRLMAVAVDASDTRFAFGERRTVLEWPYSLGFAGRSYDVSPDGQRFLAIKEGGSDTETQIDIIIVENWTEELKRLVPTQ
jgi:serine/threonine-protein kinase